MALAGGMGDLEDINRMLELERWCEETPERSSAQMLECLSTDGTEIIARIVAAGMHWCAQGGSGGSEERSVRLRLEACLFGRGSAQKRYPRV